MRLAVVLDENRTRSCLLAALALGLAACNSAAPEVDRGTGTPDLSVTSDQAGADTGTIDQRTTPREAGNSDTMAVDKGNPTDIDTSTYCAETQKYIYLATAGTDPDLLRFDPAALTTTVVGKSYPAGAMTSLGSMAVDASGDGWQIWTETGLYKMDLATASSTHVTAFTLPNGGQDEVIGLTSAWDSAARTQNFLFLSDGEMGHEALYKMNGTNYNLTKIGDYTGIFKGEWVDIASEGTGRVIGFATPSSGSSVLGEIDPTTGATMSSFEVSETAGAIGRDIACWGGYVWIFAHTAEAPMYRHSAVRVTWSTKKVDIVVADNGPIIYGAGSSSICPLK